MRLTYVPTYDAVTLASSRAFALSPLSIFSSAAYRSAEPPLSVVIVPAEPDTSRLSSSAITRELPVMPSLVSRSPEAAGGG